jgi:hypothetical protein
LLLLRALRSLVLVRQLVEVLLEQVGEIFLHRSGSAAATSATATSTTSAAASSEGGTDDHSR